MAKYVIDIPDEQYEWIKTHKGVTDFQTTLMLYKKVMNATPLEEYCDSCPHQPIESEDD